MSGYRTETLNIRGIAYSVYHWGDDAQPLLFMLHGWGDSGRTFQMLADEMLPAWHIIAPDWRGFGTSGWSGSGYHFADYLADLDALLECYSPGYPARLVGHSMGGNIAALYAGSRPDRVAALANLEGFGLKDAAPTTAPERYGRWLAQQRTEPTPSIFADFEELAGRIRKRHPGVSHPAALFAARQWARRIGDKVMLKADPKHRRVNPVLYRRAEALACWRAATAPVLLMIGELSRFALGKEPFDADDGVGTYRRATRVVIENCGHMLHWERPVEVAGHLQDFFANGTDEGHAQ